MLGKTVDAPFITICPISAKPAELDVVPMESLPVPEDKDELVLRSVERTHAAFVLGPDTKVEQGIIGTLTRRENLPCMPPVHTNFG
jgi:hypothetical protein